MTRPTKNSCKHWAQRCQQDDRVELPWTHTLTELQVEHVSMHKHTNIPSQKLKNTDEMLEHITS